MKWDRSKADVDIKQTLRIMDMTEQAFLEEFDDLKLAGLLNHEIIQEFHDAINLRNVMMYNLKKHLNSL